MIPDITKLIIKLEQLEWDLAEVKKELEELQTSFMKSLTPEEFQVARLARVRTIFLVVLLLKSGRDGAGEFSV